MLDFSESIKEYAPLSKEDAFKFIYENEALRECIRHNRMIFVDGYFVIADLKYIEMCNDKIHLTKFARENLSKCALNFRKINRKREHQEQNIFSDDGDGETKMSIAAKLGQYSVAAASYVPFLLLGGGIAGMFVPASKNYEKRESSKSKTGELYRLDRSEIDKRLLLLNSEYATTLENLIEIEDNKGIHSRFYNIDSDDVYDSVLNFLFKEKYIIERELDTLLGNPDVTLSNCLWFMIEKKGWESANTFWERTLLNKNYFTKIKNNKLNKVTKETLLALCVGLGLTFRMTEKVFKKAGLAFKEHDSTDQVYIMILEYLPELSIDDFNNILVRFDIEPLGSKMKD